MICVGDIISALGVFHNSNNVPPNALKMSPMHCTHVMQGEFYDLSINIFLVHILNLQVSTLTLQNLEYFEWRSFINPH